MNILNFIFILIIISFLGCKKNSEPKKAMKTEKRPPKNIILLIGDGMGVAQVYAGLTAKQDNLQISRCKFIGFSKTYSASHYITDSAAGGTALATGKKTNNGYIGVNANGDSIPSILEIAEQHNKATGLVATAYITHATPASFIAHHPDRHDYEAIAADFFNTDVDVLFGGGKAHFNQRKDSVNLLSKFAKNGYQVIDTITRFDEINTNKVAAIMYNGHPPKISENRGDMLTKSTMKAIEILSKNDNGFFLMSEGSQIDWGGHANETNYIVKEMIDFDDMVGKVLDFAQKDSNTLVIITADHECGGFSLIGGNIKDGKVIGKFNSIGHTAEMVPVFAFGPGAEEFMGIYENTDIFEKMKNLWGF